MRKQISRCLAYVVWGFMSVHPTAGHALSPSPEWMCCNGGLGPQCAEYQLAPERCEAVNQAFKEAQKGWDAQGRLNTEIARHLAKMEDGKSFVVDSDGEVVSSGGAGKVERAIKEN
jgi:hypothetical protein